MTIETKLFELRDRATFIPIIASRMRSENEDEQECYLLGRAGYSSHEPFLILLTRLDGGQATYDPYGWGGRTFPVAHQFIAENWDALFSGDVVDVEHILGEKPEKKISERYTA